MRLDGEGEGENKIPGGMADIVLPSLGLVQYSDDEEEDSGKK